MKKKFYLIAALIITIRPLYCMEIQKPIYITGDEKYINHYGIQGNTFIELYKSPALVRPVQLEIPMDHIEPVLELSRKAHQYIYQNELALELCNFPNLKKLEKIEIMEQELNKLSVQSRNQKYTFLITTKACLALAFQHPTMFHLLKEKPEDIASYPQINSLCKKWLRSNNEEIKTIAKAIRFALKKGEEANKNENIIPLLAMLEKLHNANKYLVSEETINHDDLALLNSLISANNDGSLNLFSGTKLLLEYKKKYHALNKNYDLLINSINDKVSILKKQLREMCPGVKPQNTYLIKYLTHTREFSDSELKPIMPLPEHLPCLTNITNEHNVTNDQNEWIPLHNLTNKNKKRSNNNQKKSKNTRSRPGHPKSKITKQPLKKSKPRENNAGDTLDSPSQNNVMKPSEYRAPDNSAFLSETADFIKFDDPKNNSTVKLLKKSQSTDESHTITWAADSIKNLKKTPWVQEWYKDPSLALEKQGYTDPACNKFTPEKMYWKTIAYHTPPEILEQYIIDHGTQTSIASRKHQDKMDIAFSLPGIIVYNNQIISGKKLWESGIFAWFVDGADNETIFHAEFRPMETSKMANQWIDYGYLPLNFPTLQEVAEYEKN